MNEIWLGHHGYKIKKEKKETKVENKLFHGKNIHLRLSPKQVGWLYESAYLHLSSTILNRIKIEKVYNSYYY